MKKIPTLFIRNPENMSLVTREVNPEAAWVLDGEGIATIKRDGTNAKISVVGGGYHRAWKRRNPTREEKALGAEPGYVILEPGLPENNYHWAAIEATDFSGWPDGEWEVEVLGPKVQGGAESDVPCLYPFSFEPIRLCFGCVVDFDSIQSRLEHWEIEGIVWHHPDGRMAKVKRRDFGFPWPVKKHE